MFSLPHNIISNQHGRLIIPFICFMTILSILFLHIFGVTLFEAKILLKSSWQRPRAALVIKEVWSMITTESPDLLVKNESKLSRLEILEEVSDAIRSLPRPPFISEGRGTTGYNGSCAVPPSILDVKFVNTYWQVANKSIGTLYLFGAYYDSRDLTVKEMKGPVVRILGMLDRYLEPNQTEEDHCQLRFENENGTIIAKIINRIYVWNRAFGNGLFHPYLYACQIPPSHHNKIPKSVSIVRNPCDNALNLLGVQYSHPPQRKSFGVCVKGLHLPHEDNELSIRLVEWIELMRLLGADKIFLCEYQVHPNISKVMDYYQTTGFVDVTPVTLPGYLPGDSRLVHLYHTYSGKRPSNWMQELIPLNDCLYRNLYNFEYLALIDTDEVIMPLGNLSTWKELLRIIEKEHPLDFHEFSSIAFRNIYFMDSFLDDLPLNLNPDPDIPEYMYHLQHIYRVDNHSRAGQATKCFHKVDRVLTLHNHYPTNCLGGGCRPLNLEVEKGHLHHYKEDCFKAIVNCTEMKNNPKRDTTIWKYKDRLIERTEMVLKNLGFI